MKMKEKCPLGEAHGLASNHTTAAGDYCCDFCGDPVESEPEIASDGRTNPGVVGVHQHYLALAKRKKAESDAVAKRLFGSAAGAKHPRLS